MAVVCGRADRHDHFRQVGRDAPRDMVCDGNCGRIDHLLVNPSVQWARLHVWSVATIGIICAIVAGMSFYWWNVRYPVVRVSTEL
jgi:hypothetical protein